MHGKPLNLFKLPLSEDCLIEASAGTGKTFTIVALYLRLLLGLKKPYAYYRLVSAKEILVLTFTDSSSKEIRERIRNIYEELKLYLFDKNSKNTFYKRLFDEITDKEKAIQILSVAEKRIDEASIFTIHSFCQRVLYLYSLESRMDFKKQLITNESHLYYHCCSDFWRRHCHPLCKNIASIIYESWKHPKDLLNTIYPYLQGDVPNFLYDLDSGKSFSFYCQEFIEKVRKFKITWKKYYLHIRDFLNTLKIDRRKFNKNVQERYLSKITNWLEEEESYILPEELRKFSWSSLGILNATEVEFQDIFSNIDYLLSYPLKLKNLFIVKAISEIRVNLSNEKLRNNTLTFEDMIIRLDYALRQDRSNILANEIRRRFPVAMIDEFQDIDPQQYRIFRKIWHPNFKKNTLILIGDPKQAIYSFRGGDIFTYMQAKKDVDNCYTLDTNWRSSLAMVSSVNQLFSQLKFPFTFHSIPFIQAKSARKNKTLRFELDGKNQKGMHFWLIPRNKVSMSEYQDYISRVCANNIQHWLISGKKGTAILWHNDNTYRSVTASDIAVLVSNYHEASCISHALNQLNIPSIYYSSRQSVFETLEAKEILWLLQAILNPEKENTLKKVMTSKLFCFDYAEMEKFNQDILAREILINDLIDYGEYWDKFGIILMFKKIMYERRISEKLVTQTDGKMYITNILHISELLQNFYLRIKNKHALLRWLIKNISMPDTCDADHHIRLENKEHLIRIITVYKAKGLEYPLVWLPFFSTPSKKIQFLYHDRDSFKKFLDLKKKNKFLAEQERLAEDMRLLYVAVTRSIWHCSLGIAPVISHRSNSQYTDLHLSAIGRLIQKDQSKNYKELKSCLSNMSSEFIELTTAKYLENSTILWNMSQPKKNKLHIRRMHRKIIEDWNVTSYSKMIKSISESCKHVSSKIDIKSSNTNMTSVKHNMLFTQHTFPQGVMSGLFLHSLFEKINFTSSHIPECWIQEKLISNGFAIHWQPVLITWIKNILELPLLENGMSLNQISTDKRLVEMKFYIPLKKGLSSSQINHIICKYDSLSAKCNSINFEQIYGFLTGHIDLVVFYKGYYYLLDYKSNWLGKDTNSYTHLAMQRAIEMHRYDLQYQIYSVALHRYLRHRIFKYSYEYCFGGVIYLFIRGINSSKRNTGVYFVRPHQLLIENLDNYFSNT